jgi:AAA+ superfamily predicted ATPase
LENKNSKKLTSKNKKIFDVYTRDWKKGDFVRVMNYDVTGLPSPFYGFLICMVSEEDTQIKIFPRYKVYALDMQREEEVEAHSLELISAVG